MKNKLLTLLMVCGISSLLHAQTGCNVGYETPIFSNSFSVPANTVFTLACTASNAGTLTGISVNGITAGGINIRMAVYDDNAGLPGNLIAYTSSVPVAIGTVTAPVTPVFIVPGVYHVGAVVDMGSSPVSVDASTTTIYASSMTFSGAFPATGAGFATLPGNTVNIWMNVTCSSSGIDESSNSSLQFISGYPNPVKDGYELSIQAFHSETLWVELYNPLGQLEMKKEVQLVGGLSTIPVRMDQLDPGIYFERIVKQDGELVHSRSVVKY